jgi:hypothetical protein
VHNLNRETKEPKSVGHFYNFLKTGQRKQSFAQSGHPEPRSPFFAYFLYSHGRIPLITFVQRGHKSCRRRGANRKRGVPETFLKVPFEESLGFQFFSGKMQKRSHFEIRLWRETEETVFGPNFEIGTLSRFKERERCRHVRIRWTVGSNPAEVKGARMLRRRMRSFLEIKIFVCTFKGQRKTSNHWKI